MKNKILWDLFVFIFICFCVYWFFCSIEFPSESLRKVEQEQFKAVDNARK